MDDDDLLPAEYAWEGSFERTWDAVQLGEDGQLRGGSSRFSRASAPRAVQLGVKRGMLRTLFLVVDCSRAAREQDGEMRPSRLAVMQEVGSLLISRYLEQNPISTLALLIMKNGRAESKTDPSCNARQHLGELGKIVASVCEGDASLQNALELAREALEAMPSFMSREVVLLSTSLASCDPGDIHATIGALVKAKIRVSVFSLAAEVFICKRIAQQTSGTFGVATNPAHLRELLLSLVPPRPTEEGGMAPSRSLIKVGFPQRQRDGKLALCFLAGKGTQMGLIAGGYSCPQCCAMNEEIPTQCPVCNLKLVSSAELTKTYHHLFPVAAFTEVGARCPRCQATFCMECDNLIHETIHSCPGCNCQLEPSTDEIAEGKQHA